ncbi:MAG TPA: DUF5916 domain-containing protein, partial [Gemmatimonadaceae bacterium]|nr:DUF5916 domain-containing protein [Gemmatimonadaceae bacterium]
DGQPAADSTEVLVWYSSDAIYFGIRAFEPHGPVHATLADRDNISTDDFVEVFLDTFDDHRRAYVFGVNPLGVQSDGILSEGIQSHSGGIGTAGTTRDTVDLSTDYTYDSRGRVLADGYEVEIRVPFKSVRIQPGKEQRWGLNILRRVQHSGHVSTWAPARQANSSFLAQSGALAGLTDLDRGHPLEINPELTSHVDGTPRGAAWHYGSPIQQLGGNVRYALTDNLTADATVKPDFSQIESDVPQLSYDPRDALFFPEKRPFFLDGLEQFDTPSSLIYTRDIVQPVAAAKLTGTMSGTDIGFLSAVDNSDASESGTVNPVFNILRVRRGIGPHVSLGTALTDREEAGHFNRVGGLDAAVLFDKIYAVRLQGAASTTRGDSGTVSGPLWSATFERQGHRVQMHYSLAGIDPNFITQSGFVSRSNVVALNAEQAVTLYGSRGSLIESWTGDFTANHSWIYTRFTAGKSPDDLRWHISNQFTLRGGWVAVASVFLERYGYDPSIYTNYYIVHQTGDGGGPDTTKFLGTPHIPNLDIITGLTTPHWKNFDASIQAITGHDENFFEWASANVIFINANVDWRPNTRLRINALYSHQQYIRRDDGTNADIRRIPRLKVEYQVSRPIFVRLVGQYDSQTTDSLRDDSRSNDPIVFRDPLTGTFTRASRTVANAVRIDGLFAYQPTPGTVVFLGYGSSMTEDDPFAFRDVHRLTDGFFAKVSYVFRLGG